MTEDDFRAEKRTVFGVLSLLFVLRLRESAPSEITEKWARVLGRKLCLVETMREFDENECPAYSSPLHAKYVAFDHHSDVFFAEHVVDRVVLMPDLIWNWRRVAQQRASRTSVRARAEEVRDPKDRRFWVNNYVT